MVLLNPYLILGLPFGASREEAQRAYEQRRAPLRASADEHRRELADLDWAMGRIKSGPFNPWCDMTIFRLPADVDAMRVEGQGIFAPPPEPAPAETARGRGLSAAAAHEYLRFLLTDFARRAEPPAP
jgi:hypothetical protein